jgi:protein TonB
MSERNVNPVRAAGGAGLQTGLAALAHWLIHHAACRAPPELSQRLEEEWRSDVAARSSALSRLRFAIGCCWATSVLLREHSCASVAIAGAAIGPKASIGYAGEEYGFPARRTITFFLVAGLHVVLFYGLMTGLAFKVIKEIPTPFQARILRPPPARALPPLPAPQLAKPRIEMAPPYFPPTEGPIDSGDIVAQPLPSTPSGGTETLPQAASRPVLRVPGGPGSGFPNTDDYYPSIAKRMEEQGVATVGVCVSPDGRLTSAPTIAQSSGSPRLDEGALQLAKAGSGHYRAATEDGRAVNSCYSFRVRFVLRPGR